MTGNGSSAASTRSLIKLDSVKKVFYTEEVETHALSDIHLDIPEGVFVSVAGPSGCGKSTMLSLLGLLDTPTEGNYLLDGGSIAACVFRGQRYDAGDKVGLIKSSLEMALRDKTVAGEMRAYLKGLS